MTFAEFSLLALSSLFVIVDPITLIPVFLAMTPKDSTLERSRMARIACLVAAGVLLGFALLGNWVFRLLGISIAAFQLAGSILLLLIALEMLRGRPSAVRHSDEETGEGTEKKDVAVTPLGIPLLAGPGAITAVIMLHEQATDTPKQIALYGSIVAVCVLSFMCLRLAAGGIRWISPIAMKIATRLMGLLLAAIAMQFLIDAVKVILSLPK
ncbi:MAG: NAAT family transporter [Verrucomicrobiae bacterium]|nr:NAAT family transporter [Verrucomicrobiae bacterium]